MFLQDLMDCQKQSISTNQFKSTQIMNDTYIKNLGNNLAQYEKSEFDLSQIEFSQQELQFDVPLQILNIQEYTLQSNENINEQNNQQNYEILNVQDISEVIPEPPICPYSNKITQLQLPQILRTFLLNPIQNEGMFQCIIIRDDSGMNTFSPKYKLYWEYNHQYLMSAKKVINEHKYIITEDQQFNDKITLLGEVIRQKDSKTNYIIFNDCKNDNTQQLANIQFDKDNDNIKKPRKIIFQMNQTQNYQSANFISRKPILKKQFDQTIYTLDFFGRVNQPSIKNSQLIMQNSQKELIYWQFGKVNDKCFHLDFMNPIPPLLAFGVALCNFDFKNKY